MTDLIILALTIAGGVIWGMWQRWAGKRDAGKETARRVVERARELEKQRTARDADIQDDDDLVRRARNAGVMRDGSGK